MPRNGVLAPTTLPASGSPDQLDAPALHTASQILSIISRYRLGRKEQTSPSNSHSDGDLKFFGQIYEKVLAGKAIEMCLPAFPFKSPNNATKVLGRLPDKAEDFALAHLHGLCAAIQDVYPQGSTLTIISDGLVYNDLLGVPDRDVWAYGESLRAMSISKGYDKHIQFSRLKDLVDVKLDETLEEITYVCNATNFRMGLLRRFGDPNYDVDAMIAEKLDTCLTYRGYIKFLETDLQTVYPIGPKRSQKKYRKGVSYTAKQMLYRGDAFARAVEEAFKEHVRLSIHPSTDTTKISISLMPTDTSLTTPWHSTIAFRLDGTITTGHRATFESDPSLELVYQDGRPSYFREKSDLFTWSNQESNGITIEPMYPAGFLIRPAAGAPKMSIHDIDASKVRALAEINSPVVMRGFSKATKRDLFLDKARELGEPMPWKFGLVLEVKDRGEDTRGLNNVLSAEWMPFHYDGLFKTEKRTIQLEDGSVSEQLVSVPPRFQLFTGVTDSPRDTGFTIFSSSTLVFKYLPQHLMLADLRKLTWSVSTSAFDASTFQNLPLVIDHPTTGKPCLRYHEPWPQYKTKFDPTHLTVKDEMGVTLEDQGAAVCEVLDALLHDRRVAYWHSWEKGDLLVSDNTLMMHTRSDFKAGSDRELWRIHFD